MNKVKDTKVSVIIPVYNDEQYLNSCLKSVKKQIIKPLEIIVVDNNCTDGSIKIAKRFKAKIVTEPKQGLCFARNTGFNTAKGDILVRIDADTILPKDYIKNLLEIYTTNTSLAAVSGYGISRFELLPGTSKFWGWCYFTYVRAHFGHPILWGANMAIKKTYWNKLKKYLINDDNKVHEDQDLSLALASVGGIAKIDYNLTVSVQMESAQHFSKYHNYVVRMRNLKKLDKHSKRYKLQTRLKKDNWLIRTFWWALTAWSLYLLYIFAAFYSLFWNVNYWLKSH